MLVRKQEVFEIQLNLGGEYITTGPAVVASSERASNVPKGFVPTVIFSISSFGGDASWWFRQRSLVRIEADSLTYPLHIIIRYEIEKMIFNEGIDVATYAAWNNFGTKNAMGWELIPPK